MTHDITPLQTAPPLSVWRNRSLLFFVVAQFVSMTGTQMTWVALPWYVLTTTGSPVRMTLVLFAEMVPFAVFGLTAGAIVDRVNLKHLMVGCDLVRVLLVASIPTLAAFGVLEYWMIVVASALIGTFSAPAYAAQSTVIPELVGEDEEALIAGNTAVQLASQITTMSGPVLAGVLIGIIGNAPLLYVDAGTYAVSALIIGLGVTYRHRTHEGTSESLLSETFTGLKYLWENRLLRVALIFVILLVFAFVGLIDAAFPVFVRETLHAGPGALAVLLAGWGIGASVGMALYAIVAKRWKLSRGRTIAVLMTGLAIPLWIPPLFPHLLTATAGFMIAGFFDGPLTVVFHTMQQTEAPPRLRGRVISAFTAMFMLSAPLGVAIAGPILEAWGAIPWMLGMAVIFTVLAGFAWLSPTLRAA
jgi:MFS family permease